MPIIQNPAAASIFVDQVWDELTAQHVLSGSFGRLIHQTVPLELWSTHIAPDFFAFFGDVQVIGVDNHFLDRAWRTAGTVGTGGTSTQDFMSLTDRSLRGARFDAANDRISSPFVFGSQNHIEGLQSLYGFLPNRLRMRILAQWLDASNDEQDSYFGFNSLFGAGDILGITFHSDGVNWRLRHASTAGEIVGPAVDNDPHIFEILLGPNLVEFFLDDVSQGSLAEIPAPDRWPMGFEGHLPAAPNNDFAIDWVHVRYERV